MPLRTAVRQRVKLRYLEAGQGAPPLLFIHGWGCDHTIWRRQVAAFPAATT